MGDLNKMFREAHSNYEIERILELLEQATPEQKKRIGKALDAIILDARCSQEEEKENRGYRYL